MKTKLLLAFIFFSIAAQSQSPILDYYGDTGPTPLPGDQLTNFTYIGVTSPAPLDQSSSGANVTWNFNTLVAAGTSAYNNTVPTPTEAADYPNTTQVTTNTVTANNVTTTSQAFFNDTPGAVSFTGVNTTGFSLDYATNNAKVGDFPMAYGYTNTDATSGDYSYDTYSGSFTGTLVTTVDAYGTLTTNDVGVGPQSVNVTRVKTVQTLSLNYSFFTNVGTAIITTYHYYRDIDHFPYFTVAITSISVPLVSIDETLTVMEITNVVPLGVPNFTHDQIAIAPNPVGNQLAVRAENSISVTGVKIMDLNGRLVSENAYDGNPLDVSQLAKGVYFAEIETDAGNVIKKIIKD